jgi:hypothetical protein
MYRIANIENHAKCDGNTLNMEICIGEVYHPKLTGMTVPQPKSPMGTDAINISDQRSRRALSPRKAVAAESDSMARSRMPL